MRKDCAIDCEYCRHNKAVSLPQELVDATLSGNTIIFAGAGISTENKSVLRQTFYDEIVSDLVSHSETLSFSQAMQLFCERPDGRIHLVQRLRKRFDTINAFPELEDSATRFHRSLGTLFLVTDIVTTNWDSYFEKYCHALPFVDDEDIAFWGAARRRVLKIHGSIDKISSVVATSDDYRLCARRLSTSLVGGVLKNMLANKTFVFVGYSLRDDDFLQIRDFVRKQLKQFKRHAYLVTPIDDPSHASLANDGFTLLKTDGTFLIEQLKGHIRSLGSGLLSDSLFEAAYVLRGAIASEHRRLHAKYQGTNLPEIVYAAAYQDGLAHALERALAMRGSGEYSHDCHLRNLAHKYLKIQKDFRSAKRYVDVAYVEGYANGLVFLLSSGAHGRSLKVPLYFAFGAKEPIFNLSRFSSLFRHGNVPHKAARKYAQKMFARLSNPYSIEFHHPPWL
jgi:hypothetical protein